MTIAERVGAARRFARTGFAAVGADVAWAYGAFLLLALVPSLVAGDSVLVARITLAGLLGGDLAPYAANPSVRGTFIVFLAAATLAVPSIWTHRFAPLAFVAPLLVTLLGFWPLYRQHQAQQEAVEALAEFGLSPDQLARQLEAGAGDPLDHLGLGAWLLFATVIFLAFKGVTRFLARGQAATSSSAS